MGKKKTEVKTENTYDYKAPPITPEVQALKEFKATTDPTIPFHYAARRQELENSYQQPIGSYTTPAVREAANRSAGQALDMEQAAATQASQFNADNTNYGRNVTVAQMTSPQLIQTGGTQTQSQSGGFWGDLAKSLIGNAAQAGLAFATGGGSVGAQTAGGVA